jgi:diadenosine tetraphosphate (Ap4A) HIT family hydrolase
MFNPTIARFGYPQTLVREYVHWVVMLRPAQVTAGSLILAAKSEATAYGSLPTEAFVEQGTVIAEIEATLRATVAYEHINYLMLMMVDPNVHFHVIPRYAGSRAFAGIEIADAGWPGPPDLKGAFPLDDRKIADGRDAIASAWHSVEANSD